MKTNSLITTDWMGRFIVENESLSETLQYLSTLHGVSNYRLYKKVYHIYKKDSDIYDWVNGVEILKCKAIEKAWDLNPGWNMVHKLYLIGFYSNFLNLEGIETVLRSFYFNFPEELCLKVLKATTEIIGWNNLKDTSELSTLYSSCIKSEDPDAPDPFVSRLSLYMLITFLANWEMFKKDPETFIRHICTLIIGASKDTDISRNILSRYTDLEDIY